MFDAPEAQADPIHWSTRPIWRVPELPALWLGKDPKFVNAATVEPYRDSPFAAEYRNRCDLVERALEAGDLQALVKPPAFISWTEALNLPVPELLRASVLERVPKSEPNVAGELEALRNELDAQREVNVGLLRRLGELEAMLRDSEPRERRSLLIMFGSMALDKYNFNPGAPRQTATRAIKEACDRAGVTIDEKTVLKQLKASAEQIDDELSLQGRNRNSG